MHPHPRRPSTDEHDAHPPFPQLHPHAPHAPHPPHVAHTHSSPASVSARRPSEHVPSLPPRIGTIREASYDDGAAILLDADADGDHDEDESAPSRGDERSALLGGWSSRRSSGRSRRKSYGATSEPLGQKPRRNTSGDGSRSGNSRSRSKARTPPRDGRGSKSRERRSEVAVAMTSTDESATETLSRRGRDRYERPLSRETSPVTVKSTLSAIGHPRRMSVTTRFEEDSSGDEGGDVARGLAATGGAAIMGTRPGLGFVPTGATGQMDLDPAEELTPEELEVPTGADGLEVRQWSEALRVSRRRGDHSHMHLDPTLCRGILLTVPGRGCYHHPIIHACVFHPDRRVVPRVGVGRLYRSSRHDGPRCLVVSTWFSCAARFAANQD